MLVLKFTKLFPQDNGEDIELQVSGDEFYSIREFNGYTVKYDADLGLYCYARHDSRGFLTSTHIPTSKNPPKYLRKHLRENANVKAMKVLADESKPKRTFAGDNGLLPGRKIHFGKVKGLTVLVEFSDYKMDSSLTPAIYSKMLNSETETVNGNASSVKRYIHDMSCGHLTYENHVVGPVKLSQPRSYYIKNLMVREALTKAIETYGIKLKDYDSQGVGVVDAINFIYAGKTVYTDNLWPHQWDIPNLVLQGVRVRPYMLTSAGANVSGLTIGTFIHESMHLLCGFPDLYDYGKRDGDETESSGIGPYCMMGNGNHNGYGRHPAPVSSYLRDLAGWTETIELTNMNQKIEIKHGDYSKTYKFSTPFSNEYFLIENRTKRGWDAAAKSSGLAIFHCDTKGSNEWQDGTKTKHFQLALLQADGQNHLEQDMGEDAYDLFSSVNGQALSYDSNPSSRLWDRSDSGLRLSDISGAGEVMSFFIGDPNIPPPPPEKPVLKPHRQEVRIISGMVNPVGEDKGSEWVSLLNVTPEDIVVDGWKLIDDIGREFSLNGSIKAYETVKINLNEIVLRNTGGTLILENSFGVVDQVDYPSALKQGFISVF